MKMKRILPILLLAALAFQACKSQYDLMLESNDADAKYAAAFDYFNKGKYTKSAQLFESLSLLVGGTAREDTVQYYWGLSNYSMGDYYTAETNFSKFISTYPYSPLAESAEFLRVDCLYKATLRYELDQTPTYAAMNAISAYMINNPESPNKDICRHMLEDLGERLDRKAYENARLYYKMEDYKASRVAFRNILKENSENVYREDILYYVAMSSYKYAQMSVPSKQKERYMTFIDDYLNFVGEIPESKYSKELKVMYARAQRALGKYVGSEEELNMKEKEFEKERKASAKAAK